MAEESVILIYNDLLFILYIAYYTKYTFQFDTNKSKIRLISKVHIIIGLKLLIQAMIKKNIRRENQIKEKAFNSHGGN